MTCPLPLADEAGILGSTHPHSPCISCGYKFLLLLNFAASKAGIFRASWTLGFSHCFFQDIAHASVMEATMEAHHQSASKYAFRPVIM